MADKEIGIRLKTARESAKLTQQKVCEILKIPKTQTLSAYESGVNNPPVEVLKKLSRLYQVSIDWIVFGEDSSLFERKNAEYIAEFFRIVDKLGLDFREETDWNGNSTGRYVVYVENSRRNSFDSLIADLGRINGIRDVLEPDEYQMLFQKKINIYAVESNDFEEMENVQTQLVVQQNEIIDDGGLPF